MKKLIAFLIFSAAAFAQVPDCIKAVNLTGVSKTTVLDNRQAGCINWTFVYQSTGFSALSIQLEGADGAVTPGSYSAITAATGSNPSTNTTKSLATFTNVSTGWVRANLVSVTGTGTVIGTFYGYKSGYAHTGGGGSGCTPPSTTNLIDGDGAGGCDDSGIDPAAVVQLTPVQALTNKSVNGVTLDGSGSASLFLNKAGNYTAPAGGTGCNSGSTTDILIGDGMGGCDPAGIAATAAGIISLFSGCSGVQYLGADGACHNAGAGGGCDIYTTSCVPYSQVVTSDFAWTNQLTATETVFNGIPILTQGNNQGNNQWNLRTEAVPMSTPWRVRAALNIQVDDQINGAGGTQPSAGLVLLNSGTGEIILFEFANNGNGSATVLRETRRTTFNGGSGGNYVSNNSWVPQPNINVWLQMRDDGTNRYMDVSTDGNIFVNVAFQGNTDFTTPDQFGYQVGNEPGGLAVISIKSWDVAATASLN